MQLPDEYIFTPKPNDEFVVFKHGSIEMNLSNPKIREKIERDLKEMLEIPVKKNQAVRDVCVGGGVTLTCLIHRYTCTV